MLSSLVNMVAPERGADSDDKRRSKRQRKEDPIEEANKKSNDEFIKDFLRPSTSEWTNWQHPRTSAKYTVRLISSADLTEAELLTCFDLIEETSGADYRGSSVGWHPAMKKTEMRSPDLRYVLVEDADGAMKGFTSMMPTYENGEPVVYCYEIHLREELKGTGLGRQMMGYLTTAADNIPTVEKTMLTCFTSNPKAMSFYEKLGFSKDPCSPPERRLRGGKVIVPDYMIMSRATSRLSGR